MDLKGKTVVVTGSSRGIGEAIAEEFAKQGANIVLNARKPISDDMIQKLTAFGVKVETILGDISDFEVAKTIIEKTKEIFGSVDVLVNNAGINRDKLLMRMDEEDFDVTYQVNLKGSFNTIRHALPIMLKQRSGSIINISSVVGETGNPGQANYAASKAGIIGLTKSVAREAASRGITCNAITPGFIETDMTAALSEKNQKAMLEQIPLKKFGKTKDIAEAAVFLSKSDYITGQTIRVNGGMYM
ncbi:3-oxoacyl-[acyl-carrier-protein] reductase [Jeotgalibaca sp. PTS2502]|uniref:3-oxoacyl-[acyl-carrier-protein] reductase n=2 Tax=Jeotgalibaca TaxID=1470540 RepID=A0A6G7KCK4_9LACT|nr:MULTISPECIES: 3-oxoacyl-[acyl-carrier-protein] reductase [Jeotgalibaca]APZ48697.1 3-oxoacyl-[acyl-carrier-protein] reductase [Jeotgalibaca sp. PTS2502]QII82989.1 3-oxoacyl-[acyl-carrier-protein] reductase [Jeotgalibaca arthritidis]HJA90630.1 3-oxoacyl-[acyl-carrier-protein] reductase [Candidatus Jeotgalibaca merdavium]